MTWHGSVTFETRIGYTVTNVHMEGNKGVQLECVRLVGDAQLLPKPKYSSALLSSALSTLSHTHMDTYIPHRNPCP